MTYPSTKRRCTQSIHIQYGRVTQCPPLPADYMARVVKPSYLFMFMFMVIDMGHINEACYEKHVNPSAADWS